MAYQHSVCDESEIFYKNGDSFIGKCSMNENQLKTPNGEGVYKAQNFICKGYFKNGNLSGKAQFIAINDQKPFITGDFTDSQTINGISTITYMDGSVYIGNLSNNKRQGNGVLTFPQDNQFFTKYEGNFDNDTFNGNGQLFFKCQDNQQCFYYKGNFRDNKFEGKGEIFFNDVKYVGEFKNSLKEGYGELQSFQQGIQYKGQFKEDQFSGEGHLEYANGSTYKGSFLQGKKHGKGNFVQIQSPESSKIKYSGDFEQDQYHGIGQLIFFETNQIYIGDFREGMMSGKGTLKTYNQAEGTLSWFDGGFENNQKHGNCTLSVYNIKPDEISTLSLESIALYDESKLQFISKFKGQFNKGKEIEAFSNFGNRI